MSYWELKDTLWLISIVASNAFILLWALKRRMPSTPEAHALFRAIKIFERESSTILKIEKINPDHLFLRNPADR